MEKTQGEKISTICQVFSHYLISSSPSLSQPLFLERIIILNLQKTNEKPMKGKEVALSHKASEIHMQVSLLHAQHLFQWIPDFPPRYLWTKSINGIVNIK